MIQLFISHSSADATLVNLLIDLFRASLNVLPKEIRCTSVDGYRLPAGGTHIEEQLRRDVLEARVFIGLISPASLQSTYVVFELGVRWGARKNLVPLLAPGVDPTILTSHLMSFNVLRCDSAAQLQQLVHDLAAMLGSELENPVVYQSHIDQILSYTSILVPSLTEDENKDDESEGLHNQQTIHVSLFVMMPFGKEYDTLERTLRHVLEDEPYCFQVILARDRTLHPGLFDNVKAHMRMVNGFVADVSDLNPNVLLELGMTEAEAEKRPVVILRRSGSADIPADLRGRLFIEYDLPPEDQSNREERLAAQLRDAFGAIVALEKLRRDRVARYLSVSYLQSKLGKGRLTKKEAERLCKAFQTIEEIETADAAVIRRETNLDNIVVAMVQAAFSQS